jgi:transcriptional regulator GlxA family with amidase domain
MFFQLFMDSFSLTVCSHLVGLYAEPNGSVAQFKGGLAPWQKRRVVELFQQHLDGEIKLATLADDCGLSISHFARSFRRSFGTSPHRYLILQRLEISKALLSETISPLVEIAARTGFADQSAFTRTFASIIGISPAKWRREHSRRRVFIEES